MKESSKSRVDTGSCQYPSPVIARGIAPKQSNKGEEIASLRSQ